MHFLSVVIVATALAVDLRSQTLDLSKPSTVQHATFAPTAREVVAAPGARVSLSLDVTPKPNINVYAAGAKGYLPIALTVSAPSGVTIGAPVYPRSENVFFPALNERIPVHRKAFQIGQPITIPRTAKAGDAITVSGVVNYQACDDLLCFPPAAASVRWTVNVR